MARRPRRRSSRTHISVQLVQIMGLALVLVMVLLFRDEIAGGAGALFAGDETSDLRLPEERGADAPAAVTAADAGADRPD